MARGTLVGEAFIRVHADNSAFAREVAHGMHGFKEEAGEAGDEAGEEWGQRFFDSLKEELKGKMSREFKQGFLTGDFSNFAHSMGDVDEAIRHINMELDTMHREGGLLDEDFDDLTQTVRRFAAGVRDAEEHADFGRRARQGMAEYAASLTKAAREMGTFRDGSASAALSTDQLTRHMAAWDDQVVKSRTGIDNWAATLTKASESMGHFREGTTATSLDLHRLERQIASGSGFERLAAEMTEAAHALDFHRDSMERDSIEWDVLRQATRSYRVEIKEANKNVGESSGLLDNMGRALARLDDRLTKIDMGRVFGKGSRNDFLNFTGAVIGGIANMTEGLAVFATRGIGFALKPIGMLIDKLGDMDNAFGRAMSGLQEHLGGVAAVAGKIGGPVITAIAALGAASVGVVTGILVLGEALAVVTSALSLLAGGVIIAAGAIETALVGALVVAAPLLVGFAAGIGAVVTAFANMSDAQKKAFAPLGAQFKKIGEGVAKTFFRDIPVWVKAASDIMTTFAGPTLNKVAAAVRDAITGIAKDFQTPAIKKALDAWGNALGPIAGNLTAAFGKALEGAMAFFVPILPLAVELSASIKKAADTFTAWATSAAGQNAIKDFFTTAWGEAKALWQILLNVGGALQTLLNAGNAAGGKQFLGWLEEKTRALKDFLESPQGKNQLAVWFREAQKFGANLWAALEKVGGALAAMDTPANREFANKLVIGFGRLFDVVKQLTPAFEVMGKVIGFFFAGAVKILGGMMQSVADVANVFSGLFRLLGKAPGMGWATDIANDLDVLGDSVRGAGEMLSGLPDQIQMDFTANDSELILAAQKAAGIVTEQDGSTATTSFDGNVDPLKTAVGDAQKVIDGPPGAPKEVSIPFKGNLDQLVADAAGATDIIKNFNQSGVAATVPFDGDTLPLVDDVNLANRIIGTVKPTYETEFGGDTDLLMDATVNGNDIIDQVYPEWWTTFNGNVDPLEIARIQATGELLDVPIDWTTYFNGDVGQLTKDTAQANDAIIQVPADYDTSFGGETGALLDATVDANRVIEKVYPGWETAFEGDTGALMDSTEAANNYIDGVHDIHSTEFGGETGALMDSTHQANGYIGDVQDLNLTTFTGDNNPLNTAAKLGNQYIDGVHDFNTTTFNGNPAPLKTDAATAVRYVDIVPDSNTTYFYGNTDALLANIRRAKAEVSGLLAAFPGAFMAGDLGASGLIAGLAAGDIARGPQLRIIGEDGPEAVVPLRRSLARVDPSVRDLSAYAQGLTGKPGINIAEGAIQVNVPNANPRLVAESVLDRLVNMLA